MKPAPAPEDFTSPLRSPAVAARVGVWLGICFGICFVTGLISHYAQEVSQPVTFPASPSWGYRVNQGLHVITGVAAIPLLLVKLWAVYPRLFERPELGRLRALLVTAAERGSIAVLVAAAIFQLTTGLMNSTQWYPWEFSFRSTHYAVAWVAIGALILHIGVKLPVIRDALGSDIDSTGTDRPGTADPSSSEAGLTRRGLVRTATGSALFMALMTAGSTVPFLRNVSALKVRTGEGPQGVPINRSAEAAGIPLGAIGDGWTLTVRSGDTVQTFSLADLRAMEQATERLPIACVEGWSASAEWTGVRVRDLLATVGTPEDADIRVVSLQTRRAFGVSTLQSNFAADPRTLVALDLNGTELDLDHGYPARLIAPNRPGVLQTKWLTELEVLA